MFPNRLKSTRTARSRLWRQRARPGVEVLEERSLLSQFTLNGFTPNPFSVGTAATGGPLSAILTRVPAAGDLNGDGFTDLVQGEATSKIAVFRNTGSSFGPPQELTTTPGGGPAEIMLGDFNNDGRPDIAALIRAGSTSGSLDVFLNNGNGTFPTTPSSTVSLGAGNWIDEAVGDFNSDGRLDIAALNANAGSSGVEIAVNPGTGDFSKVTPLKEGTSGTADIALDAGNFDTGAARDKGSQFLDDLVVLETTATGNQVETLLSNNSTTAPTFTSKTTALAASETYQDLVSTISVNAQPNPAGVDLNGDGTDDIAVLGTVTALSPALTRVETYDGNNDGTFKSSAGTATPFGILPLSGSASAAGNVTDTIVFGDFNGDGIADVAATSDSSASAGVVDVGLSDGKGGLAANPQGPLSVPPLSALVTGDFNKDGQTDLLAAFGSRSGSGDAVLLNGAGGWTSLGPDTVLGGPYPAGGRINVAVPDPADPNVLFVGAPRGGVWITHDWKDASPTWTPLTDGQPSIAIPEHGLTLLPGSNGSAPILYAAANGPDGGILKLTSPDGGTTWNVTRTTTQFADAQFGAIVVSPADPTGNTVYVAVSGDDGAGTTTGGVWQSTDGGKTFTNLTPSAFGAVFASDLAIDPNDPTVLYTGLVDDKANRSDQGVYRIRINAGAAPTWTQANDGVITAGAGVGKFIKLAVGSDRTVSPARTVVYATIFNAGSSPATVLDRFRAEGGVASWVKLNPLSTTTDDSDDRTNHVLLAVDPANPNRIYVNGDEPQLYVGTFASGSVTWTRINPEYPNSGTEDVADITFDASATPLPILTGDRGIGISTASPAASGTFQPEDGNLSTVLFYNVAVDPADPTVAYGVAQDQLNVLDYTNNPAWDFAGVGNEIGVILIDPNNPNTVYSLANKEHGLLTRSDQAGAPGTWTSISSGITQADFPDSAEFDETSYSALAMDPGNSNHLVLGSYRVYETTTGGESPAGGGNGWKVISPDLSGGSQLHLTAIAIASASASGEVIYAATDQGKFFVSPAHPDANTAWTERDTGLPGPGGNILSTVVDPHNAQHVFVVTGQGTNNGQTVLAGVWETTNGGVSWANITGNLPSAYALYTIAPDYRFTTPVLYVGTERGVYRSTGDGATWTQFDPGLPNTEVRDLELLPQTQGGVLAAATFGRGAYEISVPAEPTLTITGPATANEGDTLTYTLTVHNNTPDSAASVSVTDTLPAGLQFVSANFGANSCTFGNGTLTCTAGTLPAGGSVTGTVTVLATAAGAAASQGSVSGTLPVTTPTPGTATATTTVVSPPLAGSGGVLQGAEGAALGTVTVATFAHADGLKPASAFAATIAWGDGTTSLGTVIQAGPTYSVQGRHAYADEGTYTVTVTVSGDGVTAAFASVAPVLAVLPDGTRGTPEQRFVAEAFGDLFGQPPSPAQLAKYAKKLPANHGHFITTLLGMGSFEHKFLTNEVTLLYTALVGVSPSGKQVKQAVASLTGSTSLARVARKWPGVSAAAVDGLLVQALVGQFLDHPSTAADVAADSRLVEHAGKLSQLATELVGSADYFIKTSS
jgi:uncharacterized repeat protein (TIGR01451 family)